MNAACPCVQAEEQLKKIIVYPLSQRGICIGYRFQHGSVSCPVCPTQRTSLFG
ncbi:hypothetical protein EI42_03685 [Thermosporothrix hazakensis]|uniref:Uncharacterized protein n=1 Tax=Thermosporothrix hazakensis TaxID=644383 RepID=A0A326U7S2_THEHA|nr:hypothetical protein EI42_03685 [Thermosporothrix hazakensis]